MRYTLSLLLMLTLFNCTNDSTVSEKDEMEVLLEQDKWVIESIEFPMERIRQGIKFSDDKQVFYIDSQGKVIPTYNEIVYELNEDTLKIVDFKFEPRFLFDKGTLISLIESANTERITLKVIHPKENTIVLKKEKM